MHRLLIALVFLTLLPACSKDPGPPPRATGSGSGQRSQKPSGPNWAAMINKVRNLDQQRTKILTLMQDAVSEYDHYKRSVKAGSPDRARLEKAKTLKADAGDRYDTLREAVTRAAGTEDLGDQLWNKRLRDFQRKFDTLSKKVRRIEFK